MRPNGYFVVVDPRALEQVLPLAAASLVRRRPQPPDADELTLLEPVVEYFDAIETNDDKWYDRALLLNVVTGARPYGPAAVLLAVQAWVVRFAWSQLGGWLGCDHAGWHQPDMSKRRSATPDGELAAKQLLDMDARTLHRWWVGPDEPWLERWRTNGSRDPLTLERAGLGAAELELLEAKGE